MMFSKSFKGFFKIVTNFQYKNFKGVRWRKLSINNENFLIVFKIHLSGSGTKAVEELNENILFSDLILNQLLNDYQINAQCDI